MKEIPLTQGKVALVDDADYDAVMQFKWHVIKIDGIFYAARNFKKSEGRRGTQYLHQFLMPGVKMIDHWDGNGLNDGRENLRSCNKSQNAANSKSRKDGLSKWRGVSWALRCNRWEARIRFQSKKYFIGYFDSEEDAARAYDEAAKKYHGEFARLNFPNL